MNEIKILRIDLSKDVCSLVGFDGAGKVLLRRRMPRDSILKLASGIPEMRHGDGSMLRRHHPGRLLR